ncbi:uncharacterized protein TNCT_675351 [Trichonephila clavata]|uniref:Non-homologous end-joining factor 1 n=1 Tax=Trichonephila clavata TaxID=2740835 RepID=A0A8X6L9M5_TRICU|nr:uncharacterized protein TNCT_675351 [Trichonephila clavata]
MMEESYDELRDVDWIQIPNFPFIMKSRFDEDGYSLMISDLKTVYVEKLNEKAVQERFQILNPYAEMRSKVILKHVKESFESILTGNPTDNNIDFAEDKISFHLKFTASGVIFIFDLQLHSLTNDKIRDYVIAPTLLLAVILNEENLALKRKIEELEKKEYSMPVSNRSNEKRKIKDIYTGLSKKSNIAAKDTIEALLYLQKNKTTCLPESLKDTPKKSPKEIHISNINLERKLVSGGGILGNEIPSSDSQKLEEFIVPQKREMETDEQPATSNENSERNNCIKVEATVKAVHLQRRKKKLFNL